MGRLKAVDTNIIARYVVQDDPAQASVAAKLLSGPCYLPDTVLVETAWLLASRYGIGRKLLAETLDDVLSLPALQVSDPIRINWAIRRFAAGADFAGMMHLISSRGAECFVSFETSLAKRAGPDSPIAIEIPD